MPKTHKEEKRFRVWVQHNAVPWSKLLARKNPRGKHKAAVRSYWGYEDPEGSVDGYRILWYLSLQKKRRDQEARKKKLKKTQASGTTSSSRTRGCILQIRKKSRK